MAGMDGTGPDGRAARLGMVVSGSLSDGVEVKLDPGASIEDVRVGRYVTVEGDRMRFFGVVTDVSLGATDPSLRLNPPDVSDPYIADVVSGTTAFGIVDVEPLLTLAADPGEAIDGPQPAKTVPSHFSPVSLASDRDVEIIFGTEDEGRFFIGNPLDMETRLCLDMEGLVQRSAGVFGKTGTGKTFLTRLLLIGVLQRSAAVNLVFDMQNEYGWKGFSEDSREVKGLKQLFPSKVAVFSLDESSSRRRGLRPDYVVRVGYQEIEPEDIHVLRDLWDLSDIAVEAAFSLERRFGARRWLGEFLSLGRAEVLELSDQIGSQPEHAERALQPPRTPPALRVHGRGVGPRLCEADPRLPEPGDTRRPRIRAVRLGRSRLRAGGQSADAPHSRTVRADGRGGAQRRSRAAQAVADNHRGGATST